MKLNGVSKPDLQVMLDIIHGSLLCKTESDMTGLIRKTKELFEAERGICAVGDIDSVKLTKIINLDYPPSWQEFYVAEELYNVDPVILYNNKRFSSFFWCEALRSLDANSCRDMMNKAGEFGLRHGIASGNHAPGNGRGTIFSFSSSSLKRRKFRDVHKEMLDVLAPHLHTALLRVCAASPECSADLTGRELEVLKWAREGKSNWEIGGILKISERTVKFHLQNVADKLDAVNKAHAVAIAMERKLV
ncbi:MAG: autoinducer binding domain-containing protein [Deltaproteobacteria bacterium]|nr:autoinducer binding domain-containing protein [Deltaproteobacteria bacterium]